MESKPSFYCFHVSLSWYSGKPHNLAETVDVSAERLINNLDGMRILGTEPSSVILSQAK